MKVKFHIEWEIEESLCPDELTVGQRLRNAMIGDVEKAILPASAVDSGGDALALRGQKGKAIGQVDDGDTSRRPWRGIDDHRSKQARLADGRCEFIPVALAPASDRDRDHRDRRRQSDNLYRASRPS